MNYYVVHVTSYIMLMKLSDMLNSRSKNIQIGAYKQGETLLVIYVHFLMFSLFGPNLTSK